MLWHAVRYLTAHKNHKFYLLIPHEIDQITHQSWLEAGAEIITDPLDFRRYDHCLINSLLSIELVQFIDQSIPTSLWVHEGSTILYNTDFKIREYISFFSKFRQIIFQSKWQSEIVFKSFLLDSNKKSLKYLKSYVDFSESRTVNPEAIRISSADNRPFKIVCIGNVSGRKNQKLLADAVKIVSAHHSIQCYFIGSTDQARPNLKEVILSDNKTASPVQWLGRIDDRQQIEALLSSADLACLPSTDESDPLFPLEAASFRVPILLSDLEVYDHIGWYNDINCMMFKNGSLESLTERITFAISNESSLKKITDSAFEKFKVHADANAFQASIENIFELKNS